MDDSLQLLNNVSLRGGYPGNEGVSGLAQKQVNAFSPPVYQFGDVELLPDVTQVELKVAREEHLHLVDDVFDQNGVRAGDSVRHSAEANPEAPELHYRVVPEDVSFFVGIDVEFLFG